MVLESPNIRVSGHYATTPMFSLCYFRVPRSLIMIIILPVQGCRVCWWVWFWRTKSVVPSSVCRSLATPGVCKTDFLLPGPTWWSATTRCLCTSISVRPPAQTPKTPCTCLPGSTRSLVFWLPETFSYKRELWTFFTFSFQKNQKKSWQYWNYEKLGKKESILKKPKNLRTKS